MDPIKMLLEYLQTNFADKLPGDAVAAIENTARDLLSGSGYSVPDLSLMFEPVELGTHGVTRAAGRQP